MTSLRGTASGVRGVIIAAIDTTSHHRHIPARKIEAIHRLKSSALNRGIDRSESK